MVANLTEMPHFSIGCVGKELSWGVLDVIGSRTTREVVQFLCRRDDPSLRTGFLGLNGPAHSEL